MISNCSPPILLCISVNAHEIGYVTAAIAANTNTPSRAPCESKTKWYATDMIVNKIEIARASADVVHNKPLNIAFLGWMVRLSSALNNL
ncbi:hypothetical protein TRP8649_03629 [Pelagimonas phthalicica]|uniref:Uncharacterized protein n=1 Tax=Pelagimonas phthalicica TaxID=1037362 RepID=A0A238JGH1_9RHOB|nr:hypothetical protein CLV87_3627 [Pelagimonas phthalicica]SMX29493.1 hypothetical protein TRP8649_03629 [Pelagimonas phthalicica]